MTIDPDPFFDVPAFPRAHPGPHSESDILSALNLGPNLWPALLAALSFHSDILATGQKQGTRYQRINSEKDRTTRR